MTNHEQLIKDIEVIEEAGGPEWPRDRVDIKTMCINVYFDKWVRAHAPDTCRAEIIAWCGEVRAWWESLSKINYSRVYPYSKDEWAWVLGMWHAEKSKATQLTASTALIHAIAEQLRKETK